MSLITIAIKGLTPALLDNEQWTKESLEYWTGVALKDSLARLKGTANRQSYDSFQHPSGALESHFYGQVESWSFPFIWGALYNDSPYAWRRDRGFSGMTDSLGRTFTHDPGTYYMEKALDIEKDWIVSRFKRSVSKALREFSQGSTGGGTP